MDFLTILINVVCSFTASLIFIYFILLIYRPRIKIWPIIAAKSDIEDSTIMAYSFKIRNNSWFKAFDINVQLYEVISYPMKNGTRNFRHLELKMKTPKWSYLSSKRIKCFNKTFCDNYVIFRTLEDLPKIFKDAKKSIQLEITLKHGLTGISAIHMREFVNGDIQEGSFQSGKEIAMVK